MTTKATSKTDEIKVEKEFKECFIITPIGSIGSEIFNKTEGLINSVLKPVLEKFNFIPIPAHHINDAGSINKQIIEKIINSELVIANLTNINPNVMYELAIRHSFGKKVITMAEHGTQLPFDINDQRTIFYGDSMIGVEIVKPQLEKAIRSCLNGKEKDSIVSNPIYDAINQVAVIKNLPTEQQDGFSLIMNRLDKIENKISGNDVVEKQNINNSSYDYLWVDVESDMGGLGFHKKLVEILTSINLRKNLIGGVNTTESKLTPKRHSFKMRTDGNSKMHEIVTSELKKAGFNKIGFYYDELPF